MVISISVSEKVAQEMQNTYPANRALVPHSRFSSQVDGCVITIYNSLKVVFQGERALDEAKKWDDNVIVPEQKTKDSSFKGLDKVWAHVGCDEVGTGDFFGPIITVACYVPYESLKELRRLGIDDSKKIADKKIKELAVLIKPLVQFEYSIINNTDYNRAIKDINMNAVKAYLHNNSIAKMLSKLDKRPLVIMDQFVERNTYYKYLTDAKNVIDNIWFETKAESKYLGVAAASILARDIFLSEMEKLSKEVGIQLPFGAGQKIDELIPNMDDDTLNKCAKLNFKNYKKTKK